MKQFPQTKLWFLVLVLAMLTFSCSGDDGSDGKDGADGINGTNGTNGINGINGTDGIPGIPGTGCSQLLVADGLKITCGSDVTTIPLFCGNATYNPITQICDTRNAQIYGYAKIGNQTWMTRNLNYNAAGSRCGSVDANATSCDVYGRLYSWEVAMDGATTSIKNPSEVKGVCPVGWHIPSNAEWDVLMEYVQTDNGDVYTSDGDASVAGKYLKATSGWDSDKNGEDKYEFAALPGGNGFNSSGTWNHGNVGVAGFWWSATESNTANAYYRTMSPNESIELLNAVKTNMFFSVRCIKN